MVRILVDRVLPYNPENTRKHYVEISCKSTDEKTDERRMGDRERAAGSGHQQGVLL